VGWLDLNSADQWAATVLAALALLVACAALAVAVTGRRAARRIHHSAGRHAAPERSSEPTTPAVLRSPDGGRGAPPPLDLPARRLARFGCANRPGRGRVARTGPPTGQRPRARRPG
jgi:hypothetical protein